MSYCFVAWPLFHSFSFFYLAGNPDRKTSLTQVEPSQQMLLAKEHVIKRRLSVAKALFSVFVTDYRSA